MFDPKTFHKLPKDAQLVEMQRIARLPSNHPELRSLTALALNQFITQLGLDVSQKGLSIALTLPGSTDIANILRPTLAGLRQSLDLLDTLRSRLDSELAAHNQKAGPEIQVTEAGSTGDGALVKAGAN